MDSRSDDKRRIPLPARLRRHGAQLLRLPATRAVLAARLGAPVSARNLHRVAVFEPLGFALNRVKKNANTSLTILFRQMSGDGLLQRDIAKWEAQTPLDFVGRERAILRDLRYAVVVRNPYARTLSAFLDKFREEKYRRKHGAFDLDPAGFASFVRYLEDGHLSADGHWDLQTRLLIVPPAHFDARLRFETLARDVTSFMDDLGRDFDAGMLAQAFPSDERKKTGASDKVRAFYDAETQARVARLYAADFEALGYDPALLTA